MRPTSNSHRRWLISVAAFVLLCGVSPADGQIARPSTAQALAEMEGVAGAPVAATLSPVTGLVTFLSTNPEKPIFLDVPASADAEVRARLFLDTFGAAFGVGDTRQLKLSRRSQVDEVGMEHVRFQQTHGGVPVTGGELTVHLRGASVVAVNAKSLPDLEGLSITPTLTVPEARTKAQEALAHRLGVTAAELSEPRLEFFNRGIFDGTRYPTRLAWFIEATDIALREYMWIDAETGMLLLEFSQLTHARDRKVYDAASGSVLPGTLVRSEGQPPTGDTDEDAAYRYSGDTYNYFFNQHGRDSFDGAGATIVSSTDYCPSPAECPFANAFWNGTQMVYGDGFPVADDVDAHEITHAVTEFTANLFYYMQSGALNESFSDIFGETVDLTNTGGTDTPAVRWLMGEDVPGFGAFRDMMDPTAFGDPGKVSDAEFFCGDDYRADWGGVHFNSGVPNHAYALMVDGGTYNGQTITGIGLAKAGKVQYRSLAYYLLSASDFLDNYNALKQACQDLIGTSGITAGNCTQVRKALDAVEMSDPWPCTPSQASVPALCPASQIPSLFHYENFDSGFGLPACPSAAVPTSWCTNGPNSLLGSFATSGVNSMWGYNRPVAGFMWVSIAPAGTLPANARMQFNHSYGFENSGSTYWDGGVVEYSTNAGSTWNDAGGLITSGATYGGTIDTSFGNPLGGRSAFVADSWGYTASQLDLASLAGQSFRYRFYLGTDSLVDELGWYIDDVRIYTCLSCTAGLLLNSGGPINGLQTYFGCDSITAGDSFWIGSTGDVTMVAPLIIYTDGFFVAPGGRLKAGPATVTNGFADRTGGEVEVMTN